jgi:ABC-2 type transport system ATP-binding protein
VTPSESAPIECVGLTKRYGDVVGVEDVDLIIAAGAITGFLGPNGAGKSTLLRVLGGLLRPTSGEARLFGASAADPGARRRLGYMPADPVFARGLSGTENLDLLAALDGAGPVDRAWASERLGLSEALLARPVGTYSSGMIQKLGIVQALQHRPDLVLLDEPANRLDPIAHRAFEELMRDIARGGRTVLLSSHTLSDVEVLCREVAMIDRGHIVVHTTTAELTARAPRRVTVQYRTVPEPLPAALADGRVDGTKVEGRVPVARPDLVRELLDDPAVEDVLIEPATLEDVFLGLYERDSRP